MGWITRVVSFPNQMDLQYFPIVLVKHIQDTFPTKCYLSLELDHFNQLLFFCPQCLSNTRFGNSILITPLLLRQQVAFNEILKQNCVLYVQSKSALRSIARKHWTIFSQFWGEKSMKIVIIQKIKVSDWTCFCVLHYGKILFFLEMNNNWPQIKRNSCKLV